MAETLEQLLTRPVPAIPYIIGRGVLPVRGKMVIGGPPKANKSFIVLNMALNLVRGENIFGATFMNKTPVMPVKRKWRVLYFEQEMGELGLQERFRGKDSTIGGLITPAQSAGLELFLKSRDMSLRLDTDEGRKFIYHEVDTIKPDVVIFDPLAKFHLSDENSAQQMGAIMRAGDRLIENYGCAVVYIHHTGKENMEFPKRGGDRLRGSSAIFADCDTFIDVARKSSPHAKEPVLRLEFELRRGEPMDPVSVRRRRNGVCEYLGEYWEEKEDETKQAPPPRKNREPYGDL